MKNVSLVSVFLFCLFSAVISEKLPLVDCETSKGPLRIEVHRDWAPLGADRFVELVQDDFFTDIAFFRCVKRFLTQFGISDNPDKKHWHNKNIPDDPNLNLGIQKNYVSFAGGGPNTRSTQIFIAFEYLDFLGKEPWETPFGKLTVHSRIIFRYK
jgi:cyclophilin family peptidyl-prolyl cis-trans isomerase